MTPQHHGLPTAEQRAAHQQLAFKAFVCGNDLRLRAQQAGGFPTKSPVKGPVGLIIDEFWLFMQRPSSARRTPPSHHFVIAGRGTLLLTYGASATEAVLP